MSTWKSEKFKATGTRCAVGTLSVLVPEHIECLEVACQESWRTEEFPSSISDPVYLSTRGPLVICPRCGASEDVSLSSD